MISSLQRASSVPSRLQNGRMSSLTAVLLLVQDRCHKPADVAMRPELWPKVLLLLAASWLCRPFPASSSLASIRTGQGEYPRLAQGP